MRLLVSGATPTVRRYAQVGTLGHLLTPHNGNRIERLLETGLPLAADNACFNGFDERAWRDMLNGLERAVRRDFEAQRRLLWVAVPDVVADARATLDHWLYYHHWVRAKGFPMAFVAQDGCDELPMPWTKMRCLFIGGSTSWKEGPVAAKLIQKAKHLGKLVHVGRVSTERRLRLFDALGVDSIDSTQFSRWPDTYIPRWAERLKVQQLGLDFSTSLVTDQIDQKIKRSKDQKANT